MRTFLAKSTQGPAGFGLQHKAGYKTAANTSFEASHEDQLGKLGGVHIRLCENALTDPVHASSLEGRPSD